MFIKDCVLKHCRNDIWLHHTASSYKVRMNSESAAVLASMAARRAVGEMTEKERYIHDKLIASGVVIEDGFPAGERRIPVKKSSSLEAVELEFSGRCNLTCAHCFSALSGENMDRETLEKVFAGIDALEPVTLVINGGEPLLNRLLPEALKEARKRHMRVNVMTNATLADERSAALFAETGVTRAVVSLDFFEGTHDAIRGAGAFKKAVNGIELFVAAKVPVLITAMVQEAVAERLEEFRDFCLGELGAAGVRFSSVMPIGKAKEHASGLGLPAARLKELFNKGVMSDGDENETMFMRLAGGRNFYCNAGIGQCYISADGEVYACHYFQNIGESMGNLLTGTLEEVCRGYLKSGAIASDFDWEKLAKCRTCGHFARCMGGCRARAKLLDGGWYAPDAYSCAMFGVE
jgi:radical SAM protein with 4Fe4S-binding SPASM domain